MDYITTTQLRTKTKHIVEGLKQGKSFILIHRSKVIGIIEPVKPDTKLFNTKPTKNH